ncbi:MAG: hypothetical protein FJW39_31990 [Acidobacteria bacterium]|nr:hypothetical protein [Acidobacteriota bacterium]
MRKLSLIGAAIAILAGAGALWPQIRDPRRASAHPQWEVRAVFPREISPARYRHVEMSELDFMAREGWELAGVTPHVYLNEERGPDGHKLVVTQTYSAYFFKRLKRTDRTE